MNLVECDDDKRCARAYDDNGAWAGMWFLCRCCDTWVVTPSWLPENGNADATDVGCDEHGNHICRKCYREGRQSAKPTSTPVRIQVPPQFVAASLDGFPAPLAKSLACWPMSKPFVVIVGCPGARKTTSAWALAKAQAQKGRRVWFLRASIAREDWIGSPNRGELLRRWGLAPWLVLDDISACNATDGWKEAFQTLLDSRLEGKRPTLITSAARQESLSTMYGDAIGSRLFLFDWIALPNKDWRQAAKAEAPVIKESLTTPKAAPKMVHPMDAAKKTREFLESQGLGHVVKK